MLFYLGVHRPVWLAQAGVPLFLSYSTMKTVRSLPRALDRWALDSGAYTEMRHGGWTVPAKTYAAAVKRFAAECGNLDWAAPQDWLCDEKSLQATGLSVKEHQKRTTRSYLELRSMGVPVIPVLQGLASVEYYDHVEEYMKAGVNLRRAPMVGLGSIKMKASLPLSVLISSLKQDGIKLHGFGLGLKSLEYFAASGVASADSTAWSVGARKRPMESGGDQNSLAAALQWREEIFAKLERMGVPTKNGGVVTAKQIAGPVRRKFR
jgi:hypothetical protein